MGNPKQSLRFAALVRVSTDQQERKGESLAIQEQRIMQAIKQQGGVLSNHNIYDPFVNNNHLFRCFAI